MRIIICVLSFLSFFHLAFCTTNVRWAVYATACSQLGIRELTGHNDGPEIDKYQKVTGAPLKSPYCASGVSWVLEQNHIPNPKSALAADYFKDKSKIVYDRRYPRATKVIHLMDIFAMWFDSPRGIHHTGFIITWGNLVETIEANTSDINTGNATREGQGWYRKKRLKRQIYQVSNIIGE